MIHGQNTVKLSEVAIAEEVVGRIRSEDLYALACQLVDGWNDDFHFLVSAACLLIVLGVECQHGDTWIADVEVALDGCWKRVAFSTILSAVICSATSLSGSFSVTEAMRSVSPTRMLSPFFPSPRQVSM